MKFRPCIDIHNGKVKQIVGGSLTDDQNQAVENYVSTACADYYADLYRNNHLTGGHVILLNKEGSEYYEADKDQARLACETFPQGMQVGGGITAENAEEFLAMGASHVIVTSYVLADGILHEDRLLKLIRAVGKEHLVLDLSCRRKDGTYYVVTDRWQTFTDVELTKSLMEDLSASCDEFLIHAVNAEGNKQGVDEGVLAILGEYDRTPVTYAGGIHDWEDLTKIQTMGKNRVDFTVGSALDLFGGDLSFEKIARAFH